MHQAASNEWLYMVAGTISTRAGVLGEGGWSSVAWAPSRLVDGICSSDEMTKYPAFMPEVGINFLRRGVDLGLRLPTT